jgi:hypothetical protein
MDFIDYQLIKYGTSDRMGSLIDYMPAGVTVNTILAKQELNLEDAKLRSFLKDSLALSNPNSLSVAYEKSVQGDISEQELYIKPYIAKTTFENVEYIKVPAKTSKGKFKNIVYKRDGDVGTNKYVAIQNFASIDENNIVKFEVSMDNKNAKTIEQQAEELRKICKL